MTNRVKNKEFEVVSLNKEGIKKAQFVSEEFDSFLSQLLTVIPDGPVPESRANQAGRGFVLRQEGHRTRPEQPDKITLDSPTAF